VPALPAPVRALTAAVRDGVSAADRARAAASIPPAADISSPSPSAEAASAEAGSAFEEAVGRLAALEPAMVAEVLGGTVRSLLEERHPDGLDGEDLRALLTDCTRAAGWAGADPEVLLVVLTGALGLTAEELPAVPPPAVARHALLLVAHLSSGAGHGTDPGAHLDAAVAELARAQTIEMP
jgi:hypothetical protein